MKRFAFTLTMALLLCTSDRGTTVVGTAASLAQSGLGSSEPAIARDHRGHRHYRAHPVWQPDGGTQELQPEEPREEKLSAYPYLYRRDPRVHLGGATQRRPARRKTDRSEEHTSELQSLRHL